jgi:hypothetical protein
MDAAVAEQKAAAVRAGSLLAWLNNANASSYLEALLRDGATGGGGADGNTIDGGEGYEMALGGDEMDAGDGGGGSGADASYTVTGPGAPETAAASSQ